MVKKVFAVLMIAAIVCTGCSSVKDSTGARSEAISPPSFGDMNEVEETISADVSRGEGVIDSGTNTKPVSEQSPVIIKNANLDVEAEDVSAAYDKLLEFAKTKGGFETSRNVSKQGEYAVLRATFKVKAEHLDEVLEFAGECGKIINTSVNSNDISAEYYDVKLRLDNMKKNLEKYYEFYDRAETLEETLMLQTEIDRITADIESYEGQIKFWNARSSDSTVSLYIREPDDPMKIKESVDFSALTFKEMGKLMKNGITTVFDFIVAAVQWTVIAVVAIFPLIVVAGVVLAVIIFIRRRKKKGK